MRDLIVRQDAIDAIVKQSVVDKTVAKRVLAQLPSAEPNESDCWGCNCPKMERLTAEPERKHGRWIKSKPRGVVSYSKHTQIATNVTNQFILVGL